MFDRVNTLVAKGFFPRTRSTGSAAQSDQGKSGKARKAGDRFGECPLQGLG